MILLRMTKKDKYSLYCVVMTERWLAGGELCRRGWEGAQITYILR